jgi:hypothetical protein
VKEKIPQQLAEMKQRITNQQTECARSFDSGQPVFESANMQYEIGERAGGISMGGIGAVHMFVKKIGLDKVIDRNLQLLSYHRPYHESDHVLTFAYNIINGGKTIDDIELMRRDENFLKVLGAKAVPDPTTAGDFCRRFKVSDIHDLMDAINSVRINVWSKQNRHFFEMANVDLDGTITPTDAETKSGMDMSYKGVWGYHPLVVSLANTGEPLYLVNRSGNVASHSMASIYADKAIELLQGAGFRGIRLRGDTDFSLTAHFDRWDKSGTKFVFGYDAKENLISDAKVFEEGDWEILQRKAAETFAKRTRPINVKEAIVVKRGYQNIILRQENVIEFLYRPGKCGQDYRIVAVRKDLDVKSGRHLLFEDERYFFYITNDDSLDMFEVVKQACERCNQENIIEQLKNGVHSFRNSLNTLEANWALMVMNSIAWSLKIWIALSLVSKATMKDDFRQANELLRMEFRSFLNHFIRVPALVIRTGRRLIIRILGWSPFLPSLFKISDSYS